MDMLQRIVLVRHAEPEIDADKPAAEWALTLRGEQSTRLLCDAVRDLGPTRVIASPELKAIQTGQIIAGALDLPFAEDERLAEQGAGPGEFLTDYTQFRALVRRHFAEPGTAVMRGESSYDAGRRYDAAVRDAAADGAPVLVSHGRIMASWLSSLTGQDAWGIWTDLRMPDLIEVDLEARTFRPIRVPLA